MPLKIKQLVPRSSTPFELGHFNVLVGPNNCGKSQTLRDIREFSTSGSESRLKIFDGIEIDLPSELEIRDEVVIIPSPRSVGHVKTVGVSCDLQTKHEFSSGETWLEQIFASLGSPESRKQLLTNLGTYLVAHLDAEGRFKIAAPCESYDIRSDAPSNAMQAFFSDRRKALTSLREAFRDAFNMDVALDWAAMRRIYLKVGEDFGEIPETLPELDALLRDAAELSEQGDGYKSFAGVAIAMLTFPNRILLLDEPEAFLHPTQARVLGRWIAKQARTRPAQVVVTSHSADFLWGIVSENSDATVIRLNRNGDATSFHVVPAATTAGLVESPLLSSQPVLDSLFHRGVVVCEGDPDRAVYQTVSHQFSRDEGGEEVLFIHSNGKGAAKTPISLLRAAGIRVCAIVDIDILNSEPELNELIQSLTGAAASDNILTLRTELGEYVEKLTELELLAALRESVESWLNSIPVDHRRARKGLEQIAQRSSKWSAVKASGIDFFKDQYRTKAEELLASLKGLGLFVVDVGELENWMRLDSSKGRKWNRAALEQLHKKACPEGLRKFVNDVVKFLHS